MDHEFLPGDGDGALAAHHVPEAVAAQYEELVLLGEDRLLQLRLGAQGAGGALGAFHVPVAEGSGDGELPVEIAVVDPAAQFLDPDPLGGAVRLVISREFNGPSSLPQDGPAVAGIGDVHCSVMGKPDLERLV